MWSVIGGFLAKIASLTVAPILAWLAGFRKAKAKQMEGTLDNVEKVKKVEDQLDMFDATTMRRLGGAWVRKRGAEE